MYEMFFKYDKNEHALTKLPLKSWWTMHLNLYAKFNMKIHNVMLLHAQLHLAYKIKCGIWPFIAKLG